MPVYHHPQAEQQLGPDWTLMKAGVTGTPEISEWLIQQLPEGGRVGIDPFLHTIDTAMKLRKELEVMSVLWLAAQPPPGGVWDVIRDCCVLQ
eukprot:scaffold124300_cov42-Prasinocladus_malaysianus.AAC.1